MSTSQRFKATYVSGDIILDTVSCELRRNGLITRLQEQPCRILALLLEKPNTVISREEFRSALWSDGTFVDFEHSLNTAIKKLRHALDDDPEHPKYIETIPRHGYRWIHDVTRPIRDAVPAQAAAEDDRAPIRHAPILKIIGSALAGVAIFVLIFVGVRMLRRERAPLNSQFRVRPALTMPGRTSSAAISPDGRYIAFLLSQEDGPDDERHVCVGLSGTDSIVVLTTRPGPYLSPRWSPDGDYVAFLSPAEPSGIFVIPALGGSARRLVPTHSWSTSFDWTPDGGAILYSDSNAPDEPRHLYHFDLQTQHASLIAGSGGAKWLRVSPDGRWLLFFDLGPFISVLPIAGGKPRLITDIHDSWIAGATWTSDSQEVVYSSQRGGFHGQQTWRVFRTGGTPKPVLMEGTSIQPDISRRPGLMVYTHFQQPILNLWRYDLRRNGHPGILGSRPILQSTQIEKAGRISPDGKKIAYESERSGFAEVWIANADGSNPIQLTNFRGGQSGLPLWSTDGKSVALFLMGVGAFTVNADGGKLDKIEGCDGWGSWSRDRSSFYCTRWTNGISDYWKVTPGNARRITWKGAAYGVESADGKFFYFTKWNLDGLYRVPIESGDETRILDEPKAGAWAYWDLKPDGIYYVSFANPRDLGSPRSLMFYKFQDRSKILVANLPERIPPYTVGFSISPDRTWMLFTKEVSPSSSHVYVIENFK